MFNSKKCENKVFGSRNEEKWYKHLDYEGNPRSSDKFWLARWVTVYFPTQNITQ